MENSTERRTVQRVKLEVPVKCGKFTGVTRDISGNGIYFITSSEFSYEKKIRFSLNLDYAIPGKPLLLDCYGQVIRVEQLGEGYGIAAKIDSFICEH